MALSKEKMLAWGNAAVRTADKYIPYVHNIPKIQYNSEYTETWRSHSRIVRKSNPSSENQFEHIAKRTLKYKTGVCGEKTEFVKMLFKLMPIKNSDGTVLSEIVSDGLIEGHQLAIIYEDQCCPNYDKSKELDFISFCYNFPDRNAFLIDPWIYCVCSVETPDFLLSQAQDYEVSNCYNKFSIFNTMPLRSDLSEIRLQGGKKLSSEQRLQKYQNLFDEPLKDFLRFYKEEKKQYTPYQRDVLSVRELLGELIRSNDSKELLKWQKLQEKKNELLKRQNTWQKQQEEGRRGQLIDLVSYIKVFSYENIQKENALQQLLDYCQNLENFKCDEFFFTIIGLAIEIALILDEPPKRYNTNVSPTAIAAFDFCKKNDWFCKFFAENGITINVNTFEDWIKSLNELAIYVDFSNYYEDAMCKYGRVSKLKY